MPKPLRLAPRVALDLLRRTLDGKARLVQTEAAEGLGLLEAFRSRDITGGAVYDSLIAESAARAGASTLLTLNRKHFERIAPERLTIKVP
jgi:predicted nucleic acid-binding protein